MGSASGLSCWKCGKPLVDLLLPVSRTAECRNCHAPLHVCRQCEFYDTRVANHCREPIAEKVKDKTRANFCGYFRPAPVIAAGGGEDKAAAAQAELEALFGIKKQ
jgi:hypothetical protein